MSTQVQIDYYDREYRVCLVPLGGKPWRVHDSTNLLETVHYACGLTDGMKVFTGFRFDHTRPNELMVTPRAAAAISHQAAPSRPVKFGTLKGAER